MENKVLNFTFDVNAVNIILKGLVELTAKESMYLILKITQDAEKQL